MALIALAADKGAPGVTTAAVALAAVWPRRALLAEADTAGGDLVYRSPGTDGRPLDPNTGMLSLAAAVRRGLAPEQLWDHGQRLSGGLDVLVGLGNAEQSAGLAGQWDTVGRAFATLADTPHPQLAADVIADCGRIGPEAASVALFPHAALVLLVARGEPEQIARVRDRALALAARLHGPQRGMAQLAQPLIGVLLVTEAQGASKVAGQVNDMLVASRAGARVVGVLAHDPAGAEQLAGRRRGRVDRSLLVRSVRKVATDLHQQYAASWTTGSPAGRPSPGMSPGAGAPPAVPGALPGADTGATPVPPHPQPQGPYGGRPTWTEPAPNAPGPPQAAQPPHAAQAPQAPPAPQAPQPPRATEPPRAAQPPHIPQPPHAPRPPQAGHGPQAGQAGPDSPAGQAGSPGQGVGETTQQFRPIGGRPRPPAPAPTEPVPLPGGRPPRDEEAGS
ncbi:hypothetical protein [Streptomyces reniochalinae]|uniref:Uncharacterized protein n=1 Tax=Streptomyces reniochalinae TaxID=2250578 RepID=A0A367E945_9ACTN|nr:hypothetical protein [Streptomyces reniochalinae]RCG14576.1 hypothetical protein DQ392_25920 [Streptomyces reniochalinae]